MQINCPGQEAGRRRPLIVTQNWSMIFKSEEGLPLGMDSGWKGTSRLPGLGIPFCDLGPGRGCSINTCDVCSSLNVYNSSLKHC